jgi:putative acetyltransferase
MNIVPVSPAEARAREIIEALDRELTGRYPGEPVHGIDVAEFEKSGGYFVLAQEGSSIVGCGAFRPIGPACAEIKRMFIRPTARKKGYARRIMRHLEDEIRRRGFQGIVLETGCNQPEAIALYVSEGYFPIPPFGPYVGNALSRCYAKNIGPVAGQ